MAKWYLLITNRLKMVDIRCSVQLKLSVWVDVFTAYILKRVVELHVSNLDISVTSILNEKTVRPKPAMLGLFPVERTL